MPIPPAFDVRLAAYGIDSSIEPDRRAVWRILEPHLEDTIERHLKRAMGYAPTLAETLKDRDYRQMISGSTAKLFRNPFDERWVADAEARARFEIDHGIDMRSRLVIARSILSELADIVARRHRFSGRRTARLLDVASRVLMLDAANAVACHNAIAVRKQQSGSDELSAAVQQFAHTADNVRTAISAAGTTLASASNRLTSLARSAGAQVDKASLAAAQTADNVNMTAGAADELSASITSIRHQASRSAEMARKSVSQADGANATIRSLSDAVEKIGSVVGLISDIADQTNLLALNATIEAARAGEAGRGFAVVAAEVKSLATQTSKATDEIGGQIALIQQATRRSVAEIEGTSQTISEITDATGAVAASVTQQASATESIAASAGRVSGYARTVAEALKEVRGTMTEAEDATVAVTDLSGSLSERTAQLEAVMTTLFAAAAKHGQAATGFRALS